MVSTVNISVQPGKEYTITLPANVTATYNGEAVTSYFIAVEGVNTIVLSSNSVVSGTISVKEILRSLYEVYDGSGGVWCYQPAIDKWTSQYSFRPDWMSSVGNRLVTFKAGKPYIHNNSAYNTFYGQAYDSAIAFVHNDAGNITKSYMAMSVEGDKPDVVHVRTEVPNVQSSDARASEFEIKEGVNYASILRDRLSPNVPGSVNDKLIKGDKMRGEIAKFQVVYFLPTVKKVLKMFNIVFNPSRGHNTTPQNSD
jgi:hypothetical protein